MSRRAWLLLVGLVACEAPGQKTKPVVEGTTEPTIAEIKEWLKRTRQLEVASVDCPPSVPVEPGYAFTCAAMAADGSAATILVEFVNRSGVTKMTLKHGIVVAAEVEATLRRDAGRVDCGKRIRPAKPGLAFTCSVDGASVTVTIEDARGGVAVRHP